MKKRIVIVGAGGFAREVRWLLNEINTTQPSYEFIGYTVSDTNKLVETDDKENLCGDFNWLTNHQDSFDCFALGIGSPAVRLKLAKELQERFPDKTWPTLVHPSVRYDASTCFFAEGVLICAGTILTVHVQCKPFSMLNLSCTVGHEAIIGAGAVLNPTVNISGGVHIGEGVLVGTGAQVLQYLTIGEGATIGAGAVVTKDIGAHCTAVGIPAKVLQRT